ncbi:MAG: hypothetical protein ABIR84_13170 [Candidatus Nitrotoga sp.]
MNTRRPASKTPLDHHGNWRLRIQRCQFDGDDFALHQRQLPERYGDLHQLEFLHPWLPASLA